MPRISVCLATFNGERFIREQLESILLQLNDDDEVIVSDDTSEDRTLDIVKSFGDHRVKIFPGQTYRSPIRNFENALRKSTGEYVFLADQDDLWRTGKVIDMLSALQDADLVLSDCTVIDADGEEIHSSFFKLNGSRKGLLRNIWRNSYLGCCMAMRRKVLQKCLPFPEFTPMHDWWIGVVAETFFTVKFIHQPLLGYRRHGVNATPTGEGSRYSYFQRLAFRVNLIKGLLGVWRRS